MPKKHIDYKELWTVALAQIEVKLDNPTQYKTWFHGTKLLEINKKNALVGVKNTYTADWLKRKHNFIIEDTLSYLCGESVKVTYKISENVAEFAQNPKQGHIPPEPSLLNISEGSAGELQSAISASKLNPKYTFENFVVGESNKMAHAAALAVADKPGEHYNPYFVYGNTGLGKTHLTTAIAVRMLEKNYNKKVVYTPAEGFLIEMVAGIKSGRPHKFREKYRDNADLLIIDDIQFISTWEQTQNEFFNTFNVLQAANKQIIIISDRPPDRLENLTPRLKSRFQGGIVVELTRPDYEHRIAILQKKLQSNMSDDMDYEFLSFIAKNVTDNIRELEGSLQKLILMKRVKKEPLTIQEVAKQLGKDTISKRKKITVSKVLKEVAREFEISTADIKGVRRTSDVALARQICMYVLRIELNYKLEEIARHLNRKDHTTIMHGIDKIKSMRMIDESFREQLVAIIENLNGDKL